MLTLAHMHRSEYVRIFIPRSDDLASGMVTEAMLLELFNRFLRESFKNRTGQPPCVQVSMAGAINREFCFSRIVHGMEL